MKQITKSSPSRITKEELEYIRNKINVIFLGNIANQYAFYFQNEFRRNDITQKVKELSPYSDEKIERWVISR